MDSLHRELAARLEEERAEVEREGREAVERRRREVEEEREEEEGKLKRAKMRAIEELKKKVRAFL